MTGRERRRKVLKKAILVGGMLSIFAILAVVGCYMWLQKIETEIQQLSVTHNADIQDFYEEREIFRKKILELEVSNKLAKMDFEEEGAPISADVRVVNVGGNSSMTTTVEKQGIKEALSDPYLFIKTQDEVEISVQTYFMEEVIITVYFLKGPKDLNDSYDYNSLKESLKHPIVRNTVKDGNFKKRLNETGIYLVELSRQNTEELYFAVNLK